MRQAKSTGNMKTEKGKNFCCQKYRKAKFRVWVLTVFLTFPCFLFSAPPIFLVRPTDQRVAEFSPAVLNCLVAGNPPPTLFWMKEASDSDGAGSQSQGGSTMFFPGSSYGEDVSVTPEGTLRISKLNLFDSTCLFSNKERR